MAAKPGKENKKLYYLFRHGLLSPFRMVCRDFILPEICKPCLFLFLRNLFYLIDNVWLCHQ